MPTHSCHALQAPPRRCAADTRSWHLGKAVWSCDSLLHLWHFGAETAVARGATRCFSLPPLVWENAQTWPVDRTQYGWDGAEVDVRI